MSVLSDISTAFAEMPMPVKIGLLGAAGVVAFVALRARSTDAAAGPNQDAFGLGGASPQPNNMFSGGSGQAGQSGTGGSGGALADTAAYMDLQLNYLARSQELAASAAERTNSLELSRRRAESEIARGDADYQFNLSKAVSEAQRDDLYRRGLLGIDLASQGRQREQQDSLLARIADFNFLFGTGDTSATNSRPSVAQQLATSPAGSYQTSRASDLVAAGLDPITGQPFGNVQKKQYWESQARSNPEYLSSFDGRNSVTLGGVVPTGQAAQQERFDRQPYAGQSRFDILLGANQKTFDQQLRQQVASNNAALDYQKELIKASQPKQKKFLGIIGGDVGKFLNGAAEIAAPLLTGGQVRYDSYAPASPVTLSSQPITGTGYPGSPATPPTFPGGVTGAGTGYLQELLARALRQAPKQPANTTPAGNTSTTAQNGSTAPAGALPAYPLGLVA